MISPFSTCCQGDLKSSDELNKLGTKTVNSLAEFQKSMVSRFQASMILSTVGDAMGYKNGDWQFNTSSKIIHQQMLQMTNQKGPLHLKMNMSWKYSDDTVMQMATAMALLDTDIKHLYSYEGLQEAIGKNIGLRYKQCIKRMPGRAPGNTCMKSLQIVDESGKGWNKVPFSDRGGGCGGAMRSACIGLLYANKNQQKSENNTLESLISKMNVDEKQKQSQQISGISITDEAKQQKMDETKQNNNKVQKSKALNQRSAVQMVIAVSIQAGRVTHHNPIGYLGSMVAAYFTFLAVNGVNPNMWAAYLLQQGFPLSQKYIKEANRESQANLNSKHWNKYVEGWKEYAKIRQLAVKLNKEPTQAKFPEQYGIIERQHFYKKISFGSWPGATGFDSVIIAYDALLSSKGSWQEFCLRGILHGGDNDSTGAIGGSWFGAVYGWKGVPNLHWKQLQDNQKIMKLGQALFYKVQ